MTLPPIATYSCRTGIVEGLSSSCYILSLISLESRVRNRSCWDFILWVITINSTVFLFWFSWIESYISVLEKVISILRSHSSYHSISTLICLFPHLWSFLLNLLSEVSLNLLRWLGSFLSSLSTYNEAISKWIVIIFPLV